MRIGLLVLLTLVLTSASPGARAVGPTAFDIEIVVDGQPLPEYAARGARYIEALKGKEFAIRLRNPLGVRVAVALSVDGLNTIDAGRSTALKAQKWVLDPYQTLTISGWQTSGGEARRFYFTSEDRGYAHWLGKTKNLGVISAVFFRERVAVPTTSAPAQTDDRAHPQRKGRSEEQSAASANPAAERSADRDEYAATGIGREIEHRVERIWLDLEPAPAASIDLRYEFRSQLVRLGVLPDAAPTAPLARRERARGFDGGFCPVPPR